MEIEKVSIVADSGLMKWVFPWSVEQALKYRLWLKKVDVLCWASASAWTFAYSASWVDWGPVWMSWTVENELFLKNKSLLRLIKRSILEKMSFWHEDWFNWIDPILNIDYLVQDLFWKLAKIDTKSLLRSPIEYIVPVTNAGSHIPQYFSNKGDWINTIAIKSHEDVFKILEATCCVPRMYKPSVNIYWEEYYDWAFSSPLPVDHNRIWDSDIIIVILTNPFNEIWVFGSLEKKLFRLFNPLLWDALEKWFEARFEAMQKIKELEKNGQAIVIAPALNLSQFDNSFSTVRKNAKLWFQAVIENKKLKQRIEDVLSSQKWGFYSESYWNDDHDWTTCFNL
jgi:predicted patatin/cPLA2 family phospholipase